MTVIRLSVAFLTFLFLRWTTNLWLPLISFIINYLTTICLSWFIGSWITRRFLLKSSILPPINPKGKAVLITGCDSGFGHSTAMELNGRGWFVFATVYDDESDGSKKLISRSIYKNRIKVIRMDVTNSENVLNIAKLVEKELDDYNLKLFAIINNAAIASGGEIEWSRPGSVEDFEQHINVNTFGVIRVTRAFLPLLRKSKSSRVINLSSILGRTSLPGLSAYCVSKAATAKFTEGLQSELFRLGVTAIDVEPWFHKTPMLNTKTIVENMRRKWNDSTDGVRTSYGGDSYLEKRIHEAVFCVAHPKNVIQTPEDVVNTLVDAVESPEPNHVYRVITPGYGFVFWLVNDILPWDVLIWVRRFFDLLPSLHSIDHLKV